MSAHGFRNSFTPLPGYFSPFPHGTSPLSVTLSIQAYRVVPADSQQIPRARCYSGKNTNNTTTHTFTYRTFHLLRCTIPDASADMCKSRLQLAACNICAPQHRTRNPCQVSHAHGLASSAIARHYTRNHNCFLLLRVLRCFTSPRQPPHRLCIHLRVTPHN